MSTDFQTPPRRHKSRCYDFIKQVEQAIASIQLESDFPKSLCDASGSENGLDSKAAYSLASALGYQKNEEAKVLSGFGRFGIVTPWAQNVIKSRGNSCKENTSVPTGGTIRDHRLRFALDLDADGIVEASVGGDAIKIRAAVAVWCGGADGKIESYSLGQKKDDVYSWTFGQTQGID